MNATLKLGSRKAAENETLASALIELTLSPPKGRDKPPLHIALALDTSSSMGGEKIAFAKMAAENFIRWMNRRDRFSLVRYGSEIDTVAPLQQLIDKDSIIGNLYEITPDGCTNMSGGYLAAVKELLPARVVGAISRVILLTDGHANEGITDTRKLEKLVARYQGSGISLSCIGFGDDFDRELLKKLADAGQGNLHFVDKIDEAPNVFFQEFGEIAGLVGQNARATIAFSPNCEAREIFAASTPCGDHKYDFRIGDMFVDRPYQIPVILSLASDDPIIRVEAEYFDLDQSDFVKTEALLTVSGHNPDAAEIALVDAEILIARTRMLGAEAMHALESANRDDATAFIEAAIRLLDENRSLDNAKLGAEATRYRRFLSKLQETDDETVPMSVSGTASRSYLADFKPEGDIVVQSFLPDSQIDMSNSRKIRDEFEGIMAGAGKHSLIVDLGNVNYIDSSGIGMLVSLLKRWRDQQCAMVLAAPVGTVMNLLKLSRLDSFFRVFASVADAHAYIEQAAQGNE